MSDWDATGRPSLSASDTSALPTRGEWGDSGAEYGTLNDAALGWFGEEHVSRLLALPMADVAYTLSAEGTVAPADSPCADLRHKIWVCVHVLGADTALVTVLRTDNALDAQTGPFPEGRCATDAGWGPYAGWPVPLELTLRYAPSRVVRVRLAASAHGGDVVSGTLAMPGVGGALLDRRTVREIPRRIFQVVPDRVDEPPPPVLQKLVATMRIAHAHWEHVVYAAEEMSSVAESLDYAQFENFNYPPYTTADDHSRPQNRKDSHLEHSEYPHLESGENHSHLKSPTDHLNTNDPTDYLNTNDPTDYLNTNDPTDHLNTNDPTDYLNANDPTDYSYSQSANDMDRFKTDTPNGQKGDTPIRFALKSLDTEALCIEGARVRTAIQTLRPVAYQADLFRAAVLYARGGVWADSKLVPLRSLDAAGVLPEKGGFFPMDVGARGIWNGLLAVPPGDPLMRAVVALILHNVSARHYGADWLAPTGPGAVLAAHDALPPAVRAAYRRDATLDDAGVRIVGADGDAIVAVHNAEYRRRVTRSDRCHYAPVWTARAVYGERPCDPVCGFSCGLSFDLLFGSFASVFIAVALFVFIVAAVRRRRATRRTLHRTLSKAQ